MFKFNLSALQVFLTLETDNPDEIVEIEYTGQRSNKEEVKDYIKQALRASHSQVDLEQAKPIEIYYILKNIPLELISKANIKLLYAAA